MTRSLQAALLAAFSVVPLAAQTSFDNSGNALLSGQPAGYYFRQVLYGVSTNADPQTGITGDITEAIAVYGNVTFNGDGTYTMSGSTMVDDSSAGGLIPLSCYLASTSCAATAGRPVSGTYAIASNGYGYISSPIVSGDFIYGLVSSQNHVFVASSTETTYTYSDMFIAAPLSSPLPSLSTFQGAYSVAGYFPGGSPVNSANAFFQMNADGNGNLGTVNVTGYYGGGGTTPISQSNTNIKYTFSGGAGVVTWPASTSANFFAGPEYFYFSPDGSFFFGGAPQGGYDMIIGVRNGSGSQTFGGLYYEAGLDQDLSALQSSGYANFDGYWGSFRALASGDIIAHDRLNSVFNSGGLGSTYYDSYTAPASASYTDAASSFQYAIGANGTMRLGAGVWPYLGITVAIRQPAFTPNSTVYIDPTGVVNAASFAPFTAGIAPGEFLAIYGTNLTKTSATAASFPFPTTLANVQVLINGVQAPIYYVTPGQISVIAPSSISGSFAQVQIVNDLGTSNTVTVPLNKTAPGVFTAENNGIGHSAALHGNLTLVNASNPAVPGETIAVYVSGLGTVFPTVADGSPAPTTSLSTTTNSISASVGGTGATVSFQGLAPGYAGLYQVNLTIPSSLAAGTYTMDISGPDSYTSESIINVGSGVGSASLRPALKTTIRKSARLSHTPGQRKTFCGPSGCAKTQLRADTITR